MKTSDAVFPSKVRRRAFSQSFPISSYSLRKCFYWVLSCWSKASLQAYTSVVQTPEKKPLGSPQTCSDSSGLCSASFSWWPAGVCRRNTYVSLSAPVFHPGLLAQCHTFFPSKYSPWTSWLFDLPSVSLNSAGWLPTNAAAPVPCVDEQAEIRRENRTLPNSTPIYSHTGSPH